MSCGEVGAWLRVPSALPPGDAQVEIGVNGYYGTAGVVTITHA